MEFFIALFGGIYLLTRFLKERYEFEDTKEERENRDLAAFEIIERYQAPDWLLRSIGDINDYSCRAKNESYINRVNNSIRLIQLANPYCSINYIYSIYLKDLVLASYGYLGFNTITGMRLDGDSYRRKEKIAFYHEIEKLMHANGKEEVEYVYKPEFRADINDDSKMCRGRIVLREYDEVWRTGDEYRYLW